MSCALRATFSSQATRCCSRYPSLFSLLRMSGNPSVATVPPLGLLPCDLDFPRVDRTPRLASAAVRFPDTSGVRIAVTSCPACPPPRSAQVRASGPALLSHGVDGVDGAHNSLVFPVDRPVFAVRGGMRSPLSGRLGDDTRGVAGVGWVQFPSTGANTCRVVPQLGNLESSTSQVHKRMRRYS